MGTNSDVIEPIGAATETATAAPEKPSELESLRRELAALEKARTATASLAENERAARLATERRLSQAERDLAEYLHRGLARKVRDVAREVFPMVLKTAMVCVTFGTIIYAVAAHAVPETPSPEDRVRAAAAARGYLRRVYPQAAAVQVTCAGSPLEGERAWCVALVDGRPIELRCDGRADPSGGNKGCGDLGPLGWR